MKKFLVLALVALVAGAAFADTDPVFSGSFSTYWAYSFSDVDAVNDSNSIGMAIDLGATIDDYNTVSVSVGLVDDVIVWDDDNDDDVMDDKVFGPGFPIDASDASELDTDDNFLVMGDFTLCTDLTGALGVDGPVGVKTKMGDFGFGTVNVANVAPKSVDMVGGSGADGGIGLGVTVDILDMISLGSVIYPENLYEENGETGVTLKVTGIADMIDVAAYFMVSEWNHDWDASDSDNWSQVTNDGPDGVAGTDDDYDEWVLTGGDDIDDDEGQNLGFSVAATLLDGGLKIGAGFAADLTSKYYNADRDMAMALQFDVAFTMVENLAVGVSFGSSDLNDFMASADLYASVTYNVMDNLGVYAAVGMDTLEDFEAETDFMYDCGITTSLKALAITLGFSNDLDFNAPEDDFDDVMFVNFSTSF